ncbi:hypothetical protein Sliba_02450 [Streptomyces nigrescens]|uniref:Uncharacterized protein n=1 Tax=Streptomyces nigrescens TaxID=1920 RepID=A0A640T9W3_STRNI|nr:hypothetical protein Sliba_02450 [Streptomyces libani subsp. libani]
MNAADTPPNRTAVAPENPEPDNVTTVPPDAGPEAGLTELNTGTGTETYVNDTPLLVPPGAVTVTCTVPDPAGAVAVICEPDTTVNAADTPPNRTAVAPENPEPDNVTTVPPDAGPEAGLTELNTGTGAVT